MTEGLFHNRSGTGGSQFSATAQGGRRGGRNKLRPSRLVHAARRGVTLVELLISMLILTIVCLAWFEIIGIQSARKEARRREAVERLSGMMDAFLYLKREGVESEGIYHMNKVGDDRIEFSHENMMNIVYPVFDNEESPIVYQLYVVDNVSGNSGWIPYGRGNRCRWLIGALYDRNGPESEAGKPFFTLPVCLGF